MNEADRSYGKEPKPFSHKETSSYGSSDPTPTRKMAWICRGSRGSSCVRPITPYLPTLRGACTPRNRGPALLEALCKVEMGDSPATLGFRCGPPLSCTCASYFWSNISYRVAKRFSRSLGRLNFISTCFIVLLHLLRYMSYCQPKISRHCSEESSPLDLVSEYTKRYVRVSCDPMIWYTSNRFRQTSQKPVQGLCRNSSFRAS